MATSVHSAKKCEPIASAEPETIVDTCELLEKEQVDYSHDIEVENQEQIEEHAVGAPTRDKVWIKGDCLRSVIRELLAYTSVLGKFHLTNRSLSFVLRTF